MLRIENVSYVVSENGKKRYILKNINLNIEKGEIVVVTGHNGSGKSTLMKIIMDHVQTAETCMRLMN